MNIQRKQIEAELKQLCVPILRECGFKGSFPNLYRSVDDFVCLINFQFYSSGGSLCSNLSYAEPNRSNVYFRKETEAKNLKVSQTRDQLRLGADREGADKWYSFGKTSYGEYRGEPMSISHLVSTINNLIKTQAEEWWASKHKQTKN